MKKVFAALLLLTAAAPLRAHADGPDGTPPEHRRLSVDDRVRKITKSLSLTPDQQTKVHQIMEDSKAKMDKVGDQVKAIREETEGKISALLTPDQKKKFDDLRERRRKKMDERRKDKGETPPAPPESQ